jgi:phage tail sheath gpL-like
MSNSASQIKPNAQAAGSFYKVGLGALTGLSALLEQKIAVLCEANSDKQTEGAQDGGMLTPLTSKEVALKFGYGSPAHLVARTLLDELAVGVEVKFFFVPENGSGTVTATVLTGTGTAVTTTGTLVLSVNGELVSIPMVKDQTLAQALATIKSTINALINLPVLVSTATPTTSVSIDSKWKGASSAVIDVTVYSNDCAGLTFAGVKTAGTGETVPTAQLAKYQNDWYVHTLNCLGNGTANDILDAFQTFNGTADAGSGKYAPENMTPSIFWTGTNVSVLATLTGVTSSRLDYNTNVYVPVPASQDIPFVNCANVLGIFVKKSNGDPKQDILGDVIPGATPPVDGAVGDIILYSFRDSLVSNGCSSVNFVDGAYYAQDIITTYHPQGETDPIFRYVRDNMIVFNILHQFKQYNLKQKNKTIAPNALPSVRITSPELYKAGVLNQIIRPFVNAGYIADFKYAKANLDVGINPTNAGRFDVLSPNLITSLLRIVAVEAQVNKYYGA